MTRAPSNAILLAAGRGTRLSALTRETHKSLLPVAGKPVLAYAIEEILARDVREVVVVTGDKRESVERFLADRYGDRVRAVLNGRYASDTNILSTEIGVAALGRPEDGYVIVETDLVIEPAGWELALDVGDSRESFWVTRGTYCRSLTGGALRADQAGRVTDLVYAPTYIADYEGWQKLLGILYVGPGQVSRDRELRQRAIGRTTSQYYMMPWVESLALLPCRARPLDDLFAASFNDVDTYRETDERYGALLETGDRSW